MQALKALVIVLGVLILVAATVLAVTIYNRATESLEETVAGFGSKELTLPPGAVLEDMSASGKHLVLRLRMDDGTSRIVVVDLDNGAPVGELDLKTGP